ncbi:hypothetical protein C0J52_18309 [Blattella germanica]|nr:hypothetical protein C0J52_18309 [Blattella germanica]
MEFYCGVTIAQPNLYLFFRREQFMEHHLGLTVNHFLSNWEFLLCLPCMSWLPFCTLKEI